MGKYIMKAGQKRIEKGLYWDRAWSLVEGCKPLSEACKNCWSANQTRMRARQTNPAMASRYSGLIDEDTGHFNGKIRIMENDIQKPLHATKPKVWAIWNDLFHENVDWHFIDTVLTVIAMCPEHTFLLLTKRVRTAYDYFNNRPTSQYVHKRYSQIRPDIVASEQRPKSLPENFPWPLPNLYLGTTAENQEHAEQRISVLLKIQASVLWVSIEPMLGPIDFNALSDVEYNLNALTGLRENPFGAQVTRFHDSKLNWVVCGGESGPRARPMNPDWPRSIRDQCLAAGVPFFFKQWGEWADNLTNYDKKQHISYFWGNDDRGDILSYKVGKKKAGRLLDGRTWEEFPK